VLDLCSDAGIDKVTYQQIWAPWRLRYIKGEKDDFQIDPRDLRFPDGADPDCFICQAGADPKNPRRHVLGREDLCVTILNHFPYNNGHLLIAPLAHKSRLDELTPDEHLRLSQKLATMVRLLERVLQPEGFNVGLNLGRVAGAGLPGHLHWHVVPRWNGDTNFMSSVAGVKVIPQSLDALWEALTAELAAHGP
jgi:ATP adenylyltransferase